jgi:hypothetical protein
MDLVVRTQDLQMFVSLVDRIPSGRGQAVQFVPIRFVLSNKL